MFLRSLFLLCLAACVAWSAPQLTVVHTVPSASYSTLVEGLDGAIYGCADGVSLFRLGRDGIYRTLCRPEQRFFSLLVVAPDGNLYGTTQHIVFRLSYGGDFDVLHEFSSDDRDPAGSWGVSLVLGGDGNLYGITYYGGLAGRGTLFRVTLEGQFSKLADFSAPMSNPVSITAAPDGALWGLATNGTNEARQIFRATLDGVITDPITSGMIPGAMGQLFAHTDGQLYSLADQSFNSWIPVLLRISMRGEIAEVQRFSGVPRIETPNRATLGNDGQIYFGGMDFASPVNLQHIFRLSTAGLMTDVTHTRDPRFVRLNEAAPLISHDGWLYTASSGPNGQNGVFARLRLREYPEVNLPPLARADYIRPPGPGEETWINLLANDSDANGDAISLVDVSAPKHGSIEVDHVRGRVRYTAPANPVLEDSFTYRISDANGAIGIGRAIARADVRGQFSGFLLSPEPEQDGRIEVALGSAGAISGRLWLGGWNRRFSGHFDSENRFTVAALQNPFAPRSLTLALQMGGNTPVISAKVQGANTSVEGELTRANLKTANQLAGAYTFALPSNPAWKTLPGRISAPSGDVRNPVVTALGDGFGIARLSKNGIATVTGKMPDGSPFSSRQALDRGGQLLFFAPLYVNPRSGNAVVGWVRGPVSFEASQGGIDATGDLRWVLPHVLYYGGDFLKAAVPLAGSRYVPPASFQSALGISLRFQADEDGGFPSFAASTLVNGDVMSGAASFRVNAKFSPASGVLAGHFSPPGMPHWLQFSGILLQNQSRVVGQFRPIGGRGTAGFVIGD